MIEYRTATLPELEEVLEWAAEEGWNPGLDDAEAFFKADPQGFFVAVDHQNQPLAAISVVNHTNDFAFLGLYIVRPEHRGQSIGLGLWNHALRHAGNRTVGLDGVEAQQRNYLASGFVYAGATTRFSGHIQGERHADARIVTAEDVPELINMEAIASGVPKPEYLSAWFTCSANRTTFSIQEHGKIKGFCTIRSCRSGAKIGPLVAEETQDARQLIEHAATLFEGPVTLDVPETAWSLSGLCDNFDLKAGFKTARMYRGSFRSPNSSNFAVASLELG